MRKIALTLAVLFSLPALAEKVTVKVPEMVCQACAMSMTKAFKDVVKDRKTDIVVNIETKTLTLNLSAVLSDEEISQRIAKSGEYTAETITR